MNIFKRLFRKPKKKKEPECWYNDFYARKKRGAASGDNTDSLGVDSALESKMFFIASSN